MGKLASSPTAFARTLSLQRANARAKSSRAAEGPHQVEKLGGQISKRIDVLLTNLSSSSIDLQSKGANDDAHDAIHSAVIKRSLSQDIHLPDFKPCFSSLSERIDRGLDLWDREFSSMSSYASDLDSFLCSLQRSVDSGSSQITVGSKGKREDGSSSSSWSDQASLADESMQIDEQGSFFCTKSGLNGSQWRVGPPSHLLSNHEYSSIATAAPTDHKKEVAGCVERCQKLAFVSQGVGQSVSARFGSQALCDKLVKASTLIRKGYDENIEKGKIDISIDHRTISCQGNPGSQSIRYGEDRAIKASPQSEGHSVCEHSIERCKVEKEMLLKETGGLCGSGAAEAELPPNSVAVEKESVNPEEDFRESMYEMMMEKGDVEEDMEELLNCYLLLNPTELHHIIREAFSHVWIDIIMSTR